MGFKKPTKQQALKGLLAVACVTYFGNAQAVVPAKKHTSTQHITKKAVTKKLVTKRAVTKKPTAPKAAAKPAQKKHLVAVEPVWKSVSEMVLDDSRWTASSLLAGNTDPHETSATPSMVRALRAANIAIVNGGGYDNWAKAHLAAPHLILASSFATKGNVDPHYFLDPIVVEHVADKIHSMVLLKTSNKNDRARLMKKKAESDTHFKLLKAKMGRLRTRALGKQVAMTELAGESLLKEAGFVITDEPLALAATDGRNVSPQQQARLEQDIKTHKITFLVINSTHAGGVGAYLEKVARENTVPVVNIPDTLPAGKNWIQWINAVIDDIEAALAANKLGIMN